MGGCCRVNASPQRPQVGNLVLRVTVLSNKTTGKELYHKDAALENA